MGEVKVGIRNFSNSKFAPRQEFDPDCGSCLLD